MIRQDGTLWAWGWNGNGQLGDGTTTQRLSPVQIGTGTSWVAVAVGSIHSLALKQDGTLWAWGNNAQGQLGDGTQTQRLSPVQIGTGTSWVAVAVGSIHSVALRQDGTVWAWGYNGSGQLGDGTTTQRLSPVPAWYGQGAVAVAAGYNNTLVLRQDGILLASGQNDSGELGDGTTTQRLSPVQIGTGTSWRAVAAGSSHGLAKRVDGTLWAWGYNGSGQLGDGTTTQRLSPVQIGTGTNWGAVAGGYNNTLALKQDGTLWAWGYNGSGGLGDGTIFNSYLPEQVAPDKGWEAVSAGQYQTVALEQDGTVWAWGSNNYGQLGDGTTTQRMSPVKVLWPFFVTGIVKDLGTQQAIAGVTVTVKDQTNAILGTATTDQAGNFSFRVDDVGYFTVIAAKPGYEMKSTPQTAQVGISSPAQVTMYMALAGPSQYILLNPGWNFISTPIQPADTAIGQVLLDVASNVATVWGWDNQAQTWTYYFPGQSNNTLTTIQSGKGYWIYANTGTTLVVPGTTASSFVHLYEGWNLIGYNGTDSAQVLTELNSITDKWSIVWTWDSGVWSGKDKTIAVLPVSALTGFNVGKAYWIKVKQGQATDWTQ
jgi:alpha-tubulin suppressor-like RCC1 family protein